jgi:dTDP-4-amino-4,6-dideoxygalactose transaminase
VAYSKQIAMVNHIPFSNIPRQYKNLREEILDVTDKVLSSGILMDGEYTQKFESWLAEKNNDGYAVTCTSGTVALELIAKYIMHDTPVFNDITTPTVILPSLTYVATANVFANAGWNICFADVDKHGLIKPKSIQDDNSSRLTVLVGLYGSNIKKAFATSGSDLVIEDAAQHWLSDDCQRYGFASAISFDPTKNFGNYANGGAIVTDNKDLAKYAKQYRNNGKPNNSQTGSNLRMSEVDCAQIMVKSKYIDEWQSRRREIFAYWLDMFEKNSIDVLIDKDNFDKHCYHKFVISHNDRNRVKQRLEDKSIETKIHYSKPLFELDAFKNYPNPGVLSNATMLSRSVLSLPCYPELSDSEIEYIGESVIESTCY